MFDIAYLVEASITASEILRDRSWKKIFDCDLTKPFTGAFFHCLNIDRYNNLIMYWSIMYGTHGT